MATLTKTASVMTVVRNGVSTTPSGYDVGGPGSGSSYNNSIYMTFPSFGIPSGSIIHSATLNYTMTGWDWKAGVTISVQACAYAGTPTNQAPVTGSSNGTAVPASTLISSFDATNAAKQMFSSGAYHLKMFAPNGENRKTFTSTNATLTINYTAEPNLNPPSGVNAPGTIKTDSKAFSWGDGSDNNGIIGASSLSYDLQVYNGLTWGATLSTSANVKSLTVDLRNYLGKGSGEYFYEPSIKIRVRSKVYYNGQWYYSSYRESGTGIIDWRYPLPQKPSSVTAPGTITADSKTFSWGSGSDSSELVSATSLSYDMQIYNGSSWGAVFSTGANVRSQTIDLRSYFGKSSGQYYYNAGLKIRVRSKVYYGGSWYYSSYRESSIGAIEWRVTPSVPSSLSLSKSSAYEGESMTFTVGRPSSYNSYDNSGALMGLTYYIRLANGSVIASAVSDVNSASKALNYTAANLTTGKNDYESSVKAYCKDAENQVSGDTSSRSFTIKRHRAPIITAFITNRGETSAEVNIGVTDTGYGGTQTSSQVSSVQYQIEGGTWTNAPIGSWVGLSNKFTVSGLNVNAQYSINLRCTNTAEGTVSSKTSAVYSTRIYEYLPAFFMYKDATSGVQGIATKSIIVGDNYAESVNEGEVRANSITVDGDVTFQNNALVANNGGESNIDHIWHDDASNAWHFVSDAAYKATGNSKGYFGSLYEGGTAISSKYLGKTATAVNSDTVDGYHASIGNAGNTVATRNSSGYLQAQMFQDVSSWDIGNVQPYWIHCSNTNADDRFHRRIYFPYLANRINAYGSAINSHFKKLLWSGNWGGGSITVGDIGEYFLVEIWLSGTENRVFASVNTSYLLGIGGNGYISIDTVGVHLQRSGTTLTFVGAIQMTHDPNGGAHSTITNRSVTRIYGLV